jgi:hypothetical protein
VIKEGDMSTMDHKPDRYDIVTLMGISQGLCILTSCAQAQHPHWRGRHREEGHPRLDLAVHDTLASALHERGCYETCIYEITRRSNSIFV